MPFKPVQQPKCPKCSKSVYAAEEILAAGQKWHKNCFKCGLCQKRLDSTNASEHDSQIFCKQCYGRKFGPKGYGFGQGAGTLNMDTGVHLGNTETLMSNKPTDPNYG
ncbi:muscle LIM protein 1-like [Tachypleus tridentatus]|uniref:muscle LIM protein 1-like n=1 Tax=Tachypleus tridentatus TaxID=6853 RepID=UPI003FD2BA02